MKKKLVVLFTGLCLLGTMTACSQKGKEYTNTIYCKVYTAKIKKLFFSNDEYKNNDQFTFFSSSHSSYDFEQGAIDILEDHDYLVFLHKAIDNEDFTFSDIGSFSISDPINNIILKNKNKYVFSEIYEAAEKSSKFRVKSFGLA